MKNLRTNKSSRVLFLLLVVALVAGVGGAAWAKYKLPENVTQAGAYEFAATYRVAPVDDGPETVVELARVGQVVVTSSCGAGHDENGDPAMGGIPLSIGNTGPGPVAVAATFKVPDSANEFGQMETRTAEDWIYSTDVDPFWVGGPGLQYTPEGAPEGSVDVITFTIMDPAPDGVSVTGTLGYSYTRTATDPGQCVFTIQMKG